MRLTGRISEETFNEQLKKCTTEQEAQKLITDTLYSAYGDLKTAYDETAASTIAAKEAEAEYNAVTAQIGEQMEPSPPRSRGLDKRPRRVLRHAGGY